MRGLQTPRLLALTTVVAIAVAAASGAHAQSDPGLRNDLRSGLILPGYESRGGRTSMQAMVESPPAPEAPSFSFELEIAGAFASNAGFTTDDEEEAYSIGPTASVTYRHPNFIGQWRLQTSLVAGASYFDESDFDEGVGVWNIQLARDLRPSESVSFFHQSTALFDGDFGDQALSQRDFGIGYKRGVNGGRSRLQVLVYYQDASQDRDRAVARADLGHTFQSQPLGAEWSFGQRLQFSNYNDSDRDDALLSRTTFGPSWRLGAAPANPNEDNRPSFGITAGYSHNLTDGDDASGFDIGTSITMAF